MHFFFATGLFIVLAGCKPELIIDNPYETVNWTGYGRYKADLHAHTTRSDGYFSPQVVVDRYHELGYDILAIADHNMVTYPWQEFSSFEVSARTYRRLDEGQLNDIPREYSFVYEDRDPEALGMLAIQANEISQHHHMGSYFNDHPGGALRNESETLEAIGAKDGLAVLFHPGRHPQENEPVEWYVDLFRRYDHLIGMEAYNNGWHHNPGNLHKWDSSLIHLMPERPVWGFSNDDFHGGIMGRTWNVFLLPELSVEQVRHGMENGLFYFVYAPLGHDGPPPPEIKSITSDSKRGIIQIEASGHKYIEWISDGNVVYIGDSINLKKVPGIGSYVRANIYQSKYGSLAATQPFGIRRR